MTGRLSPGAGILPESLEYLGTDRHLEHLSTPPGSLYTVVGKLLLISS
jgi:hypothetical protein